MRQRDRVTVEQEGKEERKRGRNRGEEKTGEIQKGGRKKWI